MVIISINGVLDEGEIDELKKRLPVDLQKVNKSCRPQDVKIVFCQNDSLDATMGKERIAMIQSENLEQAREVSKAIKEALIMEKIFLWVFQNITVL